MSKAAPVRRPKLREQSKQQTRLALLEAALACFTESGLDAPSLDRICERAGCTRGAFYVHFANRDELIAAAMEHRRSAVLAKLLELPLGTVSIAQVLKLFATAVEQGALPVPGAVRTGELLAACRRSKKILKTQQRLMNETATRLSQLVRADQEKGRLRTDLEPAALAMLLIALEAGSELCVDLGLRVGIGAATAALAQLLVGAKSGSPSSSMKGP